MTGPAGPAPAADARPSPTTIGCADPVFHRPAEDDAYVGSNAAIAPGPEAWSWFRFRVVDIDGETRLCPLRGPCGQEPDGTVESCLGDPVDDPDVPCWEHEDPVVVTPEVAPTGGIDDAVPEVLLVRGTDRPNEAELRRPYPAP